MIRRDDMFNFKLNFYRWKNNTYHYLLSKLDQMFDKPKLIEEFVYDDILRQFSYNGYGYYRLYKDKCPFGEYSLSELIVDINKDMKYISKVSIKEEDIDFIYNSTVEYIEKKLKHNNIRVITVDHELEFFEVHFLDSI